MTVERQSELVTSVGDALLYIQNKKRPRRAFTSRRLFTIPRTAFRIDGCRLRTTILVLLADYLNPFRSSANPSGCPLGLNPAPSESTNFAVRRSVGTPRDRMVKIALCRLNVNGTRHIVTTLLRGSMRLSLLATTGRRIAISRRSRRQRPRTPASTGTVRRPRSAGRTDSSTCTPSRRNIRRASGSQSRYKA